MGLFPSYCKSKASFVAVAIACLAFCLVLFTGMQTAHADESQDQQASAESAKAAETNGAAESEPTSASSNTGQSTDDATALDSVGSNVVDPTQRADNSFIYDTTIESLYDQAALYDIRTVQVVGEVVGDKIASGEKGLCWITLTSVDSDEPASISILISEEQAAQIDHFGRYGVTGTTFQVRGEYHQACSEHEGLPDIHATDSSVTSRGVEHPDAFSMGKFLWGLAAVALGLLLMGIYYFARERSR
jgi:hypothetical protein